MRRRHDLSAPSRDRLTACARVPNVAALLWPPRRVVASSRRHLVSQVNACLAEHELSGLDISIKEPIVAMRHTLGRARVGLDTVSVTGNGA